MADKLMKIERDIFTRETLRSLFVSFASYENQHAVLAALFCLCNDRGALYTIYSQWKSAALDFDTWWDSLPNWLFESEDTSQ